MKSADSPADACAIAAWERSSHSPVFSLRRRFLAQLTGRALLLAAGAGFAGAATAQKRDDSPAARRFELKIRQRKLLGETNTLRASVGDTVELVWTTDEVVRLHLHGYDIEAVATPEKPANMKFPAKVSGRFPISAHGFGDSAGQHGVREKTLGYLEVHPR